MKKIYIFFYLIYFSFQLNSKDYENLKSWIINSNGFISSKIDIMENNKINRYLIANSKIPKNEIIIRIENQNILSYIHPKILPICQNKINDENDDDNYDFNCLLYFLCTDMKNESSYFKPFYNYLPEIDYPNVPLFYNKSQLEKLNFLPELQATIEIMNNMIKNSYDNNFKEINFFDFKKMYYFLSSRNFEIKNDFLSTISCIVPYLELVNHKYNNNALYYFDENNYNFILYSSRDIFPNEEITISYGEKNNIEFFTFYGFTIKDNKRKFNINLKIKNYDIFLNGRIYKDFILYLIEKLKIIFNLNRIEAIKLIKNELELKNKKLENNLIKFEKNINLKNIISDEIFIINGYLKIIENLRKIKKKDIKDYFINKKYIILI